MYRSRIIIAAASCLLAALAMSVSATEYHVSVNGNDGNDGSPAKPLRTISAAAAIAQPGDVITVHGGTYREEIDPPRGGESDARRIVYRAAPGERVFIKGSEIVRGWKRAENDSWKVVVPNSFFGGFNPYDDVISGDWFNPKGRVHHTGAVYLDGHWLIEASSLDDVLRPFGEAASKYTPDGGGSLLNVSWLRPGPASDDAKTTPANGFAAQHGIQTAPCTEGGECIGWIEHGDWVRYENIDFGNQTDRIEIRAASATRGGRIEVCLDTPDGYRLGACEVPHTGGWQAWKSFFADIKPLSGKQTICLVFRRLESGKGPDTGLWFSKADEDNTTIWAQFEGVDPNEADVEINVRQAVFYPRKTGVNYITVRGFSMMHAATPWAPPTAEQVGLIGTHWSKGWIIENNDIRYSTCTGITLGKHGDKYDNTSANTAEGYVKTIERALARGWSEDNIGHHIVQGNRIAHCEQAGIVGSMGPIFCTVTGNTIHDIHVRRLFTGAEMAGIKFHGAIDTVISRNHIYRTTRGIWLDWMTQGTHVSRNLLYNNGPSEDLFVEVNHGPFMVENNLFLSSTSLLDVSEGGAYVHNLFAGNIRVFPELNRDTPYHKPHTTELAGLCNTKGGDNRFFNNIFAGAASLTPYDKAAHPVQMAGNVFLNGAQPSTHEPDAIVQPGFDPVIKLFLEKDEIVLDIALDEAWSAESGRKLVTTALLGRAKVPDLPYVQPAGSHYRIDTDYLGAKRNAADPFPGPFESSGTGKRTLRVWPLPEVDYQPDFESLDRHDAAPEWLRDAKLGIYFHWGVYSVPAFGNEWYPRHMHVEKRREYKHHVETYGDPTEFGYHDFVPRFKAEKFDAGEWADLFVKAGARFAGPVAEHHDGFAMWDSDVTPWNAMDMGPKRDLTGELAKAIRDRGMRFIATFHHARNSLWEKKPGEWTGHYDHVKRHYPSLLDDPRQAILYGYMPREDFVRFWKDKLIEVVDKYRPDIMWFDSWLHEIPEKTRAEFAAYYLNEAARWGKDVAIIRKQDDLPLSFSVNDHEKSREPSALPDLWMTDDTLSTGSWCYTQDLKIKSNEMVLHSLIDTVSKNGVLLLNISPLADGTIPEDQRQSLLALGAWLKANGEAIYATRPWIVAAEGPTASPEGGFKNHRAFMKLKYSIKDIRYTASRDGGTVYAIVMGAPEKGHTLTLAAFGAKFGEQEARVARVSLLSGEAAEWTMKDTGLEITVPATVGAGQHATVFKISLAD